MWIDVNVNGNPEKWNVEPDDYLSESLRKNGYTSVKTSCHDGACGSCTVLIDGKPMLSCEMLTLRAQGKKIETIEGLKEEAEKVVDYLTALGGEGCGYCAPGYVIMVIALKREYPNADLEQIKDYLNGNLCRCTGYVTRNEAAVSYLNN